MYPVYLFAADMTTVTLSLNQGVTSVVEECRRRGLGRGTARQLLAQEAATIRDGLPDEAKIDLTSELELKSRGELQTDYESGHILGLRYTVSNLPPEHQMGADLARMLDLYMQGLTLREQLRESGSVIVTPRPVAATLSDSRAGVISGANKIGVSYRAANETASIADRDPMSPDPAIIERGNRGHATTQNLLAKRLQERGHRPLSSTGDEPDYDLAWIVGSTLWIAEVKSLTRRNEERQLRLALGQVLRYADLLSHRAPSSRLAIMGERMPADPTWQRLCERLEVLLLWPDRLAALSTLMAEH